MSMRIAPYPRRLYSRLIVYFGLIVAAVLAFAPGGRAQSGSPRSQVIYLPDPTPRKTDPHLLLHDNAQAGTPTQEALERRNAKRRELVGWAANEMVALSEELKANVNRPNANGSMAAAAADADKIEQLAKNLAAALKAP